MQTPLQQTAVIGLVLLNAYSFGANCVERFVNYQTWDRIPENAFGAYHRAQEPFIQGFIVVPMIAGLALQVLLACLSVPGVQSWVLWTMVGASVVGFISTMILQLPIHAAFNRSGYSPELMRKLLLTDWIRKAADVVRLAATVVFLRQLLTAGSAPAHAAFSAALWPSSFLP